jgi:hypothetical protein
MVERIGLTHFNLLKSGLVATSFQLGWAREKRAETDLGSAGVTACAARPELEES